MAYLFMSVVFGALLLSVCAEASEPMRLTMASERPVAQKTMNGLCDRAIHSVGFGVSSGKLVFVRERAAGQHETIGASLGNARVMPALDLGFHSASLLARIVF